MALMHAHPGCGCLIPYSVPSCKGCQRRHDAQALKREARSERRREARRRARADPKARVFYCGADWRRLSAWKPVQSGHAREDCGRLATLHPFPSIALDGWASSSNVSALP